ncbi:MAG: Ribonuclease P protein component [Alphaproteobacteria bacterium MarineAlpha3_Bin5]|nr:MAG: Ribonuclease P protein component [Alphaproteobacteria bacterium MarineAlpha3_Bin5]
MKHILATPKLVRLKQRKEFLDIAASGKKWVTPGLILQAKKRIDKKIGIGFTVSRKVGNAVARNRAKRRLRVLASEALKNDTLAGYSFVVIGRAETNKRPYSVLRQDFVQALAKVDMISKRKSPDPIERLKQ